MTVGNMYPPHDLRGGYELMWSAVVRELRTRGHDVRVLTTEFQAGGQTENDPQWVRRELDWYWRNHRFPRFSLAATVRLERHNRRVLERQLAEMRPEVVAWFAMGGMSLSLIERVRRAAIPAIGFVHDNWMLYGPQVDRWQGLTQRAPPLAPLERVVAVPLKVDLSGAARWLFVSDHCRRRALEEYPNLADTGVVHSGVDLTLFTPVAQQGWRNQLLYVGRIDPRKGVETAIRALAELPHTHLTIVGDGDPEYIRRLDELALELGVRSRITRRRAHRDELREVYGKADVVIFPVHWQEPWGLVPLEAMAVGRPVVASGRGGSSEYLRDGSNCVIYGPPDDHLALAEAVSRLRGDEGLRGRLRAKGFETAARHGEQDFTRKAADLITGIATAERPSLNKIAGPIQYD